VPEPFRGKPYQVIHHNHENRSCCQNNSGDVELGTRISFCGWLWRATFSGTFLCVGCNVAQFISPCLRPDRKFTSTIQPSQISIALTFHLPSNFINLFIVHILRQTFCLNSLSHRVDVFRSSERLLHSAQRWWLSGRSEIRQA
jgi:hypothetical protein